MGHGKGGFRTWALVLKLVQRFQARHARRYRNLKEESEAESLTDAVPLLNQRYSSTNSFYMENAAAVAAEVCRPLPAINQSVMPEAGAVAAAAAAAVEKKLMKFTAPLELVKIPPSTKFLKVPTELPQPGPFTIASEGTHIRSSEAVQSALAMEVRRLGNLLEPENPFRTAAVLREAVVGLGTLTRRLNDLIVEDPGVVECATDVEMLVRRAGELFGSLRDFASSKGIPVKEEATEGLVRSRSNPELFFEDDAPWLRSGCLSRSSEDYAWSEGGMSTGSLIRSSSTGGCADNALESC